MLVDRHQTWGDVTYSAALIGSRLKVNTRSPDVDDLAVAREAGLVVALVSGTNGAHQRCRSRRSILSIDVVVSGSHGDEGSGVDHGVGSIVASLAEAAT